MECGVSGPPGEGNKRELAHVPSTCRALARAGVPASHAHESASVQVEGKLGSEAGLEAQRVLSTSTYLRLLVGLVLNAIDLLQQVADPVHLESGKAAVHLPAPTQAFSAPTWPNTTSQVPGSGPGSRPSWEFCPAPPQERGQKKLLPAQATSSTGSGAGSPVVLPTTEAGLEPSSTQAQQPLLCPPYRPQPGEKPL